MTYLRRLMALTSVALFCSSATLNAQSVAEFNVFQKTPLRMCSSQAAMRQLFDAVYIKSLVSAEISVRLMQAGQCPAESGFTMVRASKVVGKQKIKDLGLPYFNGYTDLVYVEVECGKFPVCHMLLARAVTGQWVDGAEAVLSNRRVSGIFDFLDGMK